MSDMVIYLTITHAANQIARIPRVPPNHDK